MPCSRQELSSSWSGFNRAWFPIRMASARMASPSGAFLCASMSMAVVSSFTDGASSNSFKTLKTVGEMALSMVVLYLSLHLQRTITADYDIFLLDWDSQVQRLFLCPRIVFWCFYSRHTIECFDTFSELFGRVSLSAYRLLLVFAWPLSCS